MKTAADFGAIGDGVTDDTDALQSYIDWAIARGEPVLPPFGPGTYLCARALTVREPGGVRKWLFRLRYLWYRYGRSR